MSRVELKRVGVYVILASIRPFNRNLQGYVYMVIVYM
nr:MAG TPA: hypothetical protein [Bacteriophage sp.]